MTTTLHNIDAHELASPTLRALYKRISRADNAALCAHAITELDDVRNDPCGNFVRVGTISRQSLDQAWGCVGVRTDKKGEENGQKNGQDNIQDGHQNGEADGEDDDGAPIYAHKLMPGLLIAPALLPPDIQTRMLDRMLHRDLANPEHRTNLHPFYRLPYPAPKNGDEGQKDEGKDEDRGEGKDEARGGDGVEGHDNDYPSFFSYPPDSSTLFSPLDPSVHKPLSIRRALERALTWITLGGQYDWTSRLYPAHSSPQFPSDLARALHALFPTTAAQAAIVNIYRAGASTMAMHRDVSEQTDRGLVSVSFGCEGLFMTCPVDMGEGDWGVDAESEVGSIDVQDSGRGDVKNTTSGDSKDIIPRKYLCLRLRSGDVVYMTQEARCAWHGVPKILPGTCPAYLADWPASSEDKNAEKFAAWRGWMAKRRINFNVRQMMDVKG